MATGNTKVNFLVQFFEMLNHSNHLKKKTIQYCPDEQLTKLLLNEWNEKEPKCMLYYQIYQQRAVIGFHTN